MTLLTPAVPISQESDIFAEIIESFPEILDGLHGDSLTRSHVGEELTDEALVNANVPVRIDLLRGIFNAGEVEHRGLEAHEVLKHLPQGKAMSIRTAEGVLKIQAKSAAGLRTNKLDLLRQGAATQEQTAIIAQNVVRLVFDQSAGLSEGSQLPRRLPRFSSHSAMNDDELSSEGIRKLPHFVK